MAINKKTVKVTLNKEVSDIKLANVKVALKDNNVDLYLEKVEVSGKEVTITTGDTLTAGKTYVVSVKDLAPVETTYNVAPAAKVEVVKTVVSKTADSQLEAKVYDKDGNDITTDYTVKFESADPSHVDENGNVKVSGFPASGVIVKPYVVVGTEKVYGATVTIKTANTEATTFEGFTIVDDNDGSGTASADKFADIDPKNVKTSIKIGEAATNNWYIAPYVLDQFGQKFSSDSTDYKYESLDPTVLVVNSSTGEITPISAGTARVKITSGNFSKVITVEVKAASELKELAVSTDNVSLSDKSPAQTIKVTAKDQYGDSFNVTGITIEENDPNGVINLGSTTVNSGSSFTITPVAGKEGTATITLKNGTVTKTINVTVTKADSTVAGYKVVIASNSASQDFEIDKAKTAAPDEDNTVKLELYAVDANGNIVDGTPVNATWKVKDYTNGFVTIDSDTNNDGITDSEVSSVTVTAEKAGTVTLVPVVGGLELSPVTITVKDSTVNLASVAVKRTTVNVNQSAATNAWGAVIGNLEGTGTDGKAKSVDPSDIKAVYSSDSSVVDSATNLSTSPTMTIHKAGRTTVTVVFKDELKLNPVAFTLNVVDDVAPTATNPYVVDVTKGANSTVIDAGDTVTITFSEPLSEASATAVNSALEGMTTLFGTNASVTTNDNKTFVITLGTGGTFDGTANITLDANTVDVTDVAGNKATGTITFVKL